MRNHAGELKTCLKAALVLADVESIYGNTVATYSKCSEIKIQAVQFIHNIIVHDILVTYLVTNSNLSPVHMYVH